VNTRENHKVTKLQPAEGKHDSSANSSLSLSLPRREQIKPARVERYTPIDNNMSSKSVLCNFEYHYHLLQLQATFLKANHTKLGSFILCI
jgi:hypothetical protein